MSTIKVEGNIGQPIAAILDGRRDEADSTHFTRLMVQALPWRTDSQLPDGVAGFAVLLITHHSGSSAAFFVAKKSAQSVL